MPLKNGHLTRVERNVAAVMAGHNSVGFTAWKLGASQSGVQKAIARPAVQAEIAKAQQLILFSEALPAAVTCLISIIVSDKMPAGARVQAAKIVLDRTLGADDANHSKEPHEMTGEELANAIAQLERIAGERARLIDVAPVEAKPVESGIFG